MRLILLRHGETLWNVEKRLQGHANSPLSPRGVAQARAIAATIRELAPARVVRSDLGRTQETAALIGHADAPADAQLRELDMGTWTGLWKKDLVASRPDLYAAWRDGTYTPDGGETWAAFVGRIETALRRWMQAGDGDLLAVVHSAVIRAAGTAFLGLTAAQLVPVSPGHLCIFSFNSPTGTAQLEAYNSGPHTPDHSVAD